MAPPSRTDFPAELYAFAQTLSGSYEDRYPLILDRAFLEHKLLLNALNLKMVAGGGSHTVANAAVNAWRGRLHGLLAVRVDAGAELPAELSARFSAALVDLWAVSRKHAATDFEAREIVLREEAAQAEVRAKELRERLDSEVALSTKIHGQLDDARAITRSMQEQIDALTLRAQKAEQDVARITLEHQLQVEAHAATVEGLRGQVSASEAALGQARADLRDQAERASVERESVRKQHMLDMDRVRTELRATKEELAAAGAALAARTSELAAGKAQHTAELNEVRAQYAKDLTTSESAAQVEAARAAGELARLQEAVAAGQRERDLLSAALDRESQSSRDAAAQCEQLRLALADVRGKKPAKNA